MFLGTLVTLELQYLLQPRVDSGRHSLQTPRPPTSHYPWQPISVCIVIEVFVLRGDSYLYHWLLPHSLYASIHCMQLVCNYALHATCMQLCTARNFYANMHCMHLVCKYVLHVLYLTCMQLECNYAL